MTHFDKLSWNTWRRSGDSSPASASRARTRLGPVRLRHGSSRVTYAVSDRILAAVMPAPGRPVEVREFARPDLPAGSALLRTARSEVCGTDVHLWHGRLSGVPYPIIPGHVSAGTLEAIRGPLRGLDGIHAPRRRSRGLLRRAPDLRAMPRVHGAPHADAVPVAPRVRDHRSGVRGLVSEAGRRRSISSLESASRVSPTVSRSTTTSAAAADC